MTRDISSGKMLGELEEEMLSARKERIYQVTYET